MAKKIFGKVMVEVHGALVNIQDLPPEQYEYFMELMHQTRLAYITLIERRGKSKN